MGRGEGKIATGRFRSNMALVRRVISFLSAGNGRAAVMASSQEYSREDEI